MTKQEFKTYAERRGMYEAALLAYAMGVALANVQCWIRG